MKVSALTAYVDQKNRWNSIFKGKQYEFQTKSGRQEIANMLDADLSPENLSCDGELSRTHINARYKSLTKAAQELMQLDPSVKMYEFYPDIRDEVFAKLIIQECMAVAAKQRKPANLNYNPSERFVEDLKQHFGVEE